MPSLLLFHEILGLDAASGDREAGAGSGVSAGAGRPEDKGTEDASSAPSRI